MVKKIDITVYVDDRMFAKHVADWYWANNIPFDKSAKASYLWELVAKGIRVNGTSGLNTTMYEGAEPSLMYGFNEAYQHALAWISK